MAGILVFGTVSELLDVIQDYRSGEIDSWPFGVEIGFLVIVGLAVVLWRSGSRKSAL